MLKKHMAGCLMATALMTVPAFAQTTTPPAGTPPSGSMQTPAASGAMSSQMTAAQFVDKAANGNMFEIQSSQAAVNKTQNSRIRDFAQRMVTDHTQAAEKMKAAAAGMTVPTELDREHTQMLQKVQQASGNDFDRTYVQEQVDAHQTSVALFETYAQNGDNAQLKQFAQQTTPTLRDHLQQITRIRDEMSGSGAMAQNQSSGAAAGASAGAAAGGGQAMAGYMTEEKPGMWRASKLRGLAVYNNNNERVGDINEILVDRQGKAEAVVIGVGGFLGIGEHDVAVPFSALQWAMNSPSASANNSGGNRPTTTSTGSAANTNTGSANVNVGTANTGTNNAGSGNNSNVPDHAVLPNASKDQLKNAPEFHYGSAR